MKTLTHARLARMPGDNLIEPISEPMPIALAAAVKRSLNSGRRHQRVWLIEPTRPAIIRTIGITFGPPTPADMTPPHHAPAPPVPRRPAPAAAEPTRPPINRLSLRQLFSFAGWIRNNYRPQKEKGNIR